MYEARKYKEKVSRTLQLSRKAYIQNTSTIGSRNAYEKRSRMINDVEINTSQLTRKRTSTRRKEIFDNPLELYNNFVLEEDANKIAQYTFDHNCAVSIRQTGKASLTRLRQHGATKPHSILDKSLKEKTAAQYATALKLKTKNKNYLNAILTHFNLSPDMEGFVPHNTNGIIDGFYITPNAREICLKNRILKPYVNANYLKIIGCSLLTGKQNVKTRKKIDMQVDWHTFFITGDYDSHDIVKFKGSRKKAVGKIPKAGDMDNPVHGDVKMLDQMNQNLNYSNVMKRYQHGAQVNYEEFAKSKGEKIIEALLFPDLPVALCDRGIWSIIRNVDELQEWYDTIGIAYPWKIRK